MGRAFRFEQLGDGSIGLASVKPRMAQAFSSAVEGPGTHFNATPDPSPDMHLAITGPEVFKGL